jgi:uncharacterized OB-fold protein
MKYGYACPTHGIIEADACADSFICLDCGERAKRVRSFNVDKASLKSHDRWDPVVGAYVRNEGEFRSLLHAGQERESREMNMDVVLQEVDARDREGLAELHGYTTDQRAEDLEPTVKANWEKAQT